MKNQLRANVRLIEVGKKIDNPVQHVVGELSKPIPGADNITEYIIDLTSQKPGRFLQAGLDKIFEGTQPRREYHFGFPDAIVENARSRAETYLSSCSWPRPYIRVYSRSGIEAIIRNRRR